MRDVILVCVGSFNPITFMHLRMFVLAKDHLIEKLQWNVLAGIISPVHDDYKKKNLAAAKHRVRMVELALEEYNIPWIRLSRWETEQTTWTSSLNTLQHFHTFIDPGDEGVQGVQGAEGAEGAEGVQGAEGTEGAEGAEGVMVDGRGEKDVRVMLLCGSDLLESFTVPGLWEEQQVEAICKTFGIVCVTREGSFFQEIIRNSPLLSKLKDEIIIVPEWFPNQVSSTVIRDAVRKGQSIELLVPMKVAAYIHEEKLYLDGDTPTFSNILPISIFENSTREFFQKEILPFRKPAIFRKIEIGECTKKWTPNHLVEAVGRDRPVVVHESSSNRLRFINKNFVYKTLFFGEFIDKISQSTNENTEQTNDKNEKNEKSETNQKTKKSEKNIKDEKNETSEKNERNKTNKKSEKNEQDEKTEKTEKTEKNEKTVKTETNEKTEKTEKLFYYFRALADDARNVPSDFRRDFPLLSRDFILPDLIESDSVFSCVLRIGSAHLGLWLHYDVLDNFLIQICGKKRAILFDPEDFDFLYLKNDKSKIFDPENVDLNEFPLFAKTRPLVVEMVPGDILFIPAFWMHYMVSLDFSVAVNAFWFNLPRELYDPKDTYGNKELQPYFRAAQGVDRALKQLECLPVDVQRFYARMLKSKIDKFLSTTGTSHTP